MSFGNWLKEQAGNQVPSFGDIASGLPVVGNMYTVGKAAYPFLSGGVQPQQQQQQQFGPELPSVPGMSPEQVQLALLQSMVMQMASGTTGTGPGATPAELPLTYEGAMAKRFGSQSMMNQSGTIDTISNEVNPNTAPLQGPVQTGQTRELEAPIEAEDMGPRRLNYQQVHHYKHNPKKAAEWVAKEQGVDPVLRRQFVKDVPDVAKQWYASQKANGGQYDVYAFYDFLEGYLDGLKEQQAQMKQGS